MRPDARDPTSPMPAQQQRSLFGRVPWWAWIAIGGVTVILAAVLAPLLVLASLVVLVAGIISLARGTPTWLGLRSRRTAAMTVAGAAVVLVIASVITSVTQHADKPSASTPVGFAAMEPTPTTHTERAATAPAPEAVPTPVVVVSEQTVTEPIAFTESVVDDNTIPQGETRVTTVGQPGEIAVVYRVTTVDGIETERVEVSRTTTVEPVGQVIANGTYVPPQTFVGGVEEAVAEDDGCDPNYAEACVPIASDVDCAWGTGDGPAYLDGVARVIGSDIYGLDRNNDGWACERD
ncbi:G5 domain-containing protein [Microbacterium sp. ZW T5_56]|uniref:G5 domain-containing protein n=1 Tax=Microbacterium sp. ZW T5_56 TaxID=3378081 RepID=UPI003851F2FA